MIFQYSFYSSRPEDKLIFCIEEYSSLTFVNKNAQLDANLTSFVRNGEDKYNFESSKQHSENEIKANEIIDSVTGSVYLNTKHESYLIGDLLSLCEFYSACLVLQKDNLKHFHIPFNDYALHFSKLKSSFKILVVSSEKETLACLEDINLKDLVNQVSSILSAIEAVVINQKKTVFLDNFCGNLTKLIEYDFQ